MPEFPSLKSKDLLACLFRVGYTVERQKGSHRMLTCEGRPRLVFGFHDGATVPPGLVRKILRDAGFSDDEAATTLRRKGRS